MDYMNYMLKFKGIAQVSWDEDLQLFVCRSSFNGIIARSLSNPKHLSCTFYLHDADVPMVISRAYEVLGYDMCLLRSSPWKCSFSFPEHYFKKLIGPLKIYKSRVSSLPKEE